MCWPLTHRAILAALPQRHHKKEPHGAPTTMSWCTARSSASLAAWAPRRRWTSSRRCCGASTAISSRLSRQYLQAAMGAGCGGAWDGPACLADADHARGRRSKHPHRRPATVFERDADLDAAWDQPPVSGPLRFVQSCRSAIPKHDCSAQRDPACGVDSCMPPECAARMRLGAWSCTADDLAGMTNCNTARRAPGGDGPVSVEARAADECERRRVRGASIAAR